jgi:hypothetical protein
MKRNTARTSKGMKRASATLRSRGALVVVVGLALLAGADVLAGVRMMNGFTDPQGHALPTDPATGLRLVNVVLNKSGQVSSTNPGRIVHWIMATNSGDTPINSLSLRVELPVDWAIDPPWDPANSGIRAFLEESGAVVAQIEWKQLTVVSTPGIPGSQPGTGTPGTVEVDIADLPAAIGMSLQPGEALRFELKLSYLLNGTTQSAADYPVIYTAFREACGFMGVDFVGESGCAKGDGSFITRAN